MTDMKYAIVDAEKAAEAGINLAFHRVKDGKVVVNENELLMLGKADGRGNSNVAKSLGGEKLMTRSETREITNQWRERR